MKSRDSFSAFWKREDKYFYQLDKTLYPLAYEEMKKNLSVLLEKQAKKAAFEAFALMQKRYSTLGTPFEKRDDKFHAEFRELVAKQEFENGRADAFREIANGIKTAEEPHGSSKRVTADATPTTKPKVKP